MIHNTYQDAKARKNNKRGPRLFFVTTESSTLTTTTMCWSLTQAGCTGLTGGECRRRRSISEDFDSDGKNQCTKINMSEE